MKKRDVKLLKYVVLPALLVLFSAWVLSGMLRRTDPNVELARTTREAVKSALRAQKEAHMVQITGSVFRLTALVTGILGPLIVVYLIYRHEAGQEITAEEMLAVLEKEGLIRLLQDHKRELGEGRGHLLKGTGEEGEKEG